MKLKVLSLLVCTFGLMFATSAMAQDITVSGTVVSAEDGEPLPGVTVMLQGTNRGTATGSDGTYEINAPSDGTLKFSYVGFVTQEIEINGRSTIDVELQGDVAQLGDVVVTGYGEQVERGNLTSSITSVSSEDFEGVSTSNANSLLQGRAAGVNIVQNSGTPGGGIKVRVRGATSINASNEPLYVIDGVPVSNASNSAVGVGNQGLNGLSTVNPQDIKSIEVLKDASATAIYGARGANGVVLITTKDGSAGDTQIDFGYSHGVKEFNNELDMLSGPEFIKMYVDGMYGDFFGYSNWGSYEDRYNAMDSFLASNGLTFGTYAGLGAIDEYGNDPSSAPTTNWQDNVFNTGITDEFNISAQGGDQTTQYFISGNYFNEDGIMKNAGFERLSGRLNLEHQISERADINSRVSYSRSTTERLENDNNIYGVLTNAILAYPTAPVRTANGDYNPSVGAFSNPVAASQVTNDAVRTRFIGNVEASYDLTDNLSVTGTAGIDRYDLDEVSYSPSFTNQGSPLGSGFYSIGLEQTWLTELRLAYTNDFGAHSLNALGVVSYQETQFERTFADGQFYPSDDLRTINNAATTTGGSSLTTNGLESYTARVNYDYDDRYLVTLTGRVDGSSRFSEDNAYGFFPSASVAWRVTNEDFMDDVESIDNLKMRLSAGITGNQGIGNFSYQALYGVASYSGTPALAPTQLANPELRWEETTQYNAGVDLAIFEERLTVTVDGYIKQTDDLLLNRPVPATTGFTGFDSNIGSIENKGLELAINSINVQTQNFSWTTDFNISHNSNEVTALYQDQPFASGFANRVAVGEPLGAFYGYVSDGLWNTQEELDNAGYDAGPAQPGDVKFVDINDDGVVNSEDQKVIGSAQPDFTGGLTNKLNYKGFELSAFLQFSYGNEIFNNAQGFYGHYGYAYNSWDRAKDRWTPENTDTNVPRSSWFDSNQNTRESDFLMYDGSYLRLKSATLAYNFTADKLEQFGLRSLRIYATGQNLITWTDYPGLDPEINTFDGSNTALGTDFFSYPHARSVKVGINIGL
ncbi:SusC/RagA family TonB-linked outer membrane protein [Fodinibius sp. SL11]|uniref:SusC/RagA family TonB-linked outer membrane protein n=1 Tax=Fodinibius sp. SL11 TaxID=3425690 RepID=UPI003F8847E5